jgi:microcystin degradation protein MlrC
MNMKFRSHKPIIAIAGLACENSTFTPSRTSTPEAFHPKRDNEILDKYPFLHSSTSLREAADWHGTLIGHALPGGTITRSVFETLTNEILSRLQTIISNLPSGCSLDGLWLDIHGAMYVEDSIDIEYELLSRIRKVIGHSTLVSASMDLHGNVSRELAHQVDLITCYRTAPHVDVLETKERACKNLLDLILLASLPETPESLKRPLKAWIPLPILLPGEQTSTRDQPAKRIYDAVSLAANNKDIIDAAIWVGYAWADEPRNRAIVIVTGWNSASVSEAAEHLAKLFWSARDEFHFVARTGSFAECLGIAVASPKQKRPFFISDSGDNPTAGGSGDVSWGLTRLLEREEFQSEQGPSVIYASLPGPQAVRVAAAAGVGAVVTVTAGAEVDDLHAGPVTFTGRVHAVRVGDVHAKTEVVIQVGSVYAIITELRKPYHKEIDFTALDLRPRESDIVVVKIGYLEPELFDMAKDWMLALTPGGVDQDLERLGHRRIRRPMWPFDRVRMGDDVDLRTRWISPSNQQLEGPDE